MKKVLLSTIALLVLSMMLVIPIKARTEEPYESRIEGVLMDPGKQWVSEDGILHIRDSYWLGTEVGTLGSSTYEDWVSFNIDLATGEGTLFGKWLLTFDTRGTSSGSAQGKINMVTGQMSGIFIGTHATGEFEGMQKKGTFEGYLLPTNPMSAVLNCEGRVTYP